MGCSSSCQIFERLSSALQWIATHKLDIQYISHVLDDFIILNNAYGSCKAQLQQFLHMCADIGVPMAEEKTFLPTQVLSFLGYELDSVKMEVRLPSDKLEKCLSLIFVVVDQTKIHLENFAKYYWHPHLCLCGGTSGTSLPKATDWLDNWGVKASLFHPYHKGSAGTAVRDWPFSWLPDPALT